VHWGNPTPAVGALVEHEGEIILARNRLWPQGMFALVTGFLEASEDPAHAVVREVREELGLDVVETRLIGNYIFERKNEVMLCYHAIATGRIELGEELADLVVGVGPSRVEHAEVEVAAQAPRRVSDGPQAQVQVHHDRGRARHRRGPRQRRQWHRPEVPREADCDHDGEGHVDGDHRHDRQACRRRARRRRTASMASRSWHRTLPSCTFRAPRLVPPSAAGAPR